VHYLCKLLTGASDVLCKLTDLPPVWPIFGGHRSKCTSQIFGQLWWHKSI